MRLSVQSSISKLELGVRIFKLRGQKTYNDGYTDIMINIYSCIFINQTFYILQNLLYCSLFLSYKPNNYRNFPFLRFFHSKRPFVSKILHIFS